MHEPAGVVEILVQILQNTPILKYSFRIPPPHPYSEIQFQNTPHPYSEIQFQNTPPPPRKWKLSEILALWLFSFRIPPPNWNLARSWHFVTFQFQNTPPPQKKNWNVARSWHFVTFQFQNTPPPKKNWNLGRSWHFVTFQFQNTPPPKKKIWNLGKSSQWETMCVELPHVETLSNPDSYSLDSFINASQNCQNWRDYFQNREIAVWTEIPRVGGGPATAI